MIECSRVRSSIESHRIDSVYIVESSRARYSNGRLHYSEVE